MSADQLSMFNGAEAETQRKASPSSFSLSKTINGKQQAVCDHWLIPVFVGEWMFGPRVQAEKVISLDNTVRKNGEFDFKVHRRGNEVTHHGEYLELNIPNRLVFSWTESTYPDAQCQLTVQFSEESGKTRLKLNVQLPAELSADKDKINKQWAARCKALAEKFK